MKAAQLSKYDKNFKLDVHNIAIPTIKPNEVLVRVKMAAVNPLETLIGTGSIKLIQDYDMPVTMGNELTGIVENVGKAVANFKKGDAIYTRLPSNKIGAFAEYVAIDSAAVARLPKNLDFSTGAAAALTGLTAYQGLHEELDAKPGETVFIPGGSGSFGQMAIPIAKDLGLTVIVSGNEAAKNRTLAIGADQYLDFRTENYWEMLADVDYVIDTLGPNEFDHELSIIKSGGRLLSLRTGPNKRFAIDHGITGVKKGLFTLAGANFDRKAKAANVQYHFIFVRSDGAQLAKITKIIEKNNIVPAIDSRSFSLNEINKALDLVNHGKTTGKVLIKF